MKKLNLLLLALVIVTQSYSQQTHFSKLDAHLASLNDSNKFMGTISIFRDGSEIYSKSVGFSDVDGQIKATPQTKYRVGSISKTFTATMIYQAIEKGLISEETKLSSYFPEVKNSDKITIEDMLWHQSGVVSFTNVDFINWATKHKTREEMLEIIKSCGVSFEPKAKSEYSNSAYVLLSFILEDVYKKSYSEVLEQQIVEPLKLKNTSFSATYDGCLSYKFFDKWRVESVANPSVLMGAGGVVSTPYDLNVFFSALFNNELVSEVELTKMKTIANHFGKGLMSFPFSGEQGFGHTGGVDGFHSISVYFPKSKVAYSAISNGLNCVFNDITVDALKCAYNMEVNFPDPSMKLTSEDLDRYLGVYSTSSLPIKITVTKNGSVLVAQGTGQASFNLTPVSLNIFEMKAAGIVMEFQPKKGVMTLKQGGGVFLMERE